MSNAQIILGLTLAINLFIGVLVYASNPRRLQNGFFLLLCTVVSIWGLLNFIIISSTTRELIEFHIRLVSYFSTLIPVTFHLVCLAISYPDRTHRAILRESVGLFVFSQLAGFACFTPFFIQNIVMSAEAGTPTGPGFPEAVYGPAFYLHSAYFVLAFTYVLVGFYRRMRWTTGVQHEEFRFVILGMSASIGVGITSNIIIPHLSGTTQTQPLGPVSVSAMNLIIAYGIATQRILDVNYIVRRTAAYVLLTTYLIGVYVVSWMLFNAIFTERPAGIPVPHLLSAILVAWSLAPAHGRLQEFASRLFINTPTVDKEKTIRDANQISQSVTRIDALLPRFADLIGGALDTDRVLILVRTDNHFEQVHPQSEGYDRVAHLSNEAPLIQALRAENDPIIKDFIVRRKATEQLEEVTQAMAKLEADAAAGIYYKGQLEGVMLLGARRSGRIYGATEQDLLVLLGNQLGVAIENAKLYTEVQDSRLYNKILVDNLVSGVVAADQDGYIKVFNQEAQRLTGLETGSATGQHINILPLPLCKALSTTLHTRHPLRDQEFTYTCEGHTLQVRAGTTTFWGHEGALLGALIVFSDVTRVKELEEQVRRHDRLASIGTLSAGMAHEIKNPLVSIKTFTELLPENYDDPEFRAKFSSLVGSEVLRIDRIVNQLLGFARPAKANLQSISLHEALHNTLKLIEEQLRKKDIRLVKKLYAPRDTIRGDADLLKQSFINFFLNAIDAMETGGTLTIHTHEELVGQQGEQPPIELSFDVKEYIQLTIQDTGIGMPEADLAHVFDPFFTTKHSGTGLGLAVSHGILEEHGVAVRVESQQGRGTTFRLPFPLVEDGDAI